ncbi:MAG: CoA transferase subunit B [Firmicutes bacterium]|nr:CoA transferase subunit B [Bacillota bacterium]
MDREARKELMVKRVAKEFKSGDVVNLGIGIPTQVANHIPEGVEIILQSENGFVGIGPAPAEGEEDKDVVNAGGKPVTILPGGACFDSATSFAIIRGGHLAATVLGALEVDQRGNLANWMVPGKMVPGMGGAMDLVTGARKVIVVTEHVTKDGAPKILKQCRLPLTAKGKVSLIVSDMAVMEVTKKGLVLKEIAPGVTVDEIRASTEAEFTVAPDLKEMSA